MTSEDYIKAYKAGKRDYQLRWLRGEKPTLEVLDDILPMGESPSMSSLGLVQIPIDQIVGTRYEGRSNAFAGNFMPILKEGSEFERKWSNLCEIHQTEGIRDPIKAVEYMNKFYVLEGNKRVSVMKYFGAVSIPGYVTRLIPQRTDEKENKIYFEFMDFYRLSKINYIWFSKEGSFAKLQKAVGKEPDELWTDDDLIIFSSFYTRFTAIYEAKGGAKLSITAGDAFLAFITLHGYANAEQYSAEKLKKRITGSWEEFTLLEDSKSIDLKLNPNIEKKPLLTRLLPVGKPKLQIGFIYERTASSSAWTYAHELGRMHLEQVFSDEITTRYYDNITVDTITDCLNQAVADGCNIIFSTTPAFASASVRAAIAFPEVRILNCSLNTSHRYIRTYYPRMHEAKFLMGAIAGAMAENDRITYIADYPLLGNIANINAFALGAKMVNPRAKVYLEWCKKKDFDSVECIQRVNPSCISGKDMVIPEEGDRYFGIYHMKDDRPHNLAMPLCHWGKFYEQLLRTIIDGTWKYDDTSNRAINYWWGMSSGVVDVICSHNLPLGTKRLIDLLKHTICTDSVNPFYGTLYSQTGIVPESSESHDLSPEAIVKMDWLAENIIGSIPEVDELMEQAIPTLAQQGLPGKDY